MQVLLALFSLVNSVEAFIFTLSNTGLHSFPGNLIPADVTKLMVNVNSLSEISPSDLEHLNSLEYLGIGDNLFQEFPNLTAVAATLNKVYAYGNNINYVDPLILESLYKLTHLSLQYNDLVTFNFTS